MFGGHKGESFVETRARRQRLHAALWTVATLFLSYEIARTLLVKTVMIDTASMEPTFRKGDVVAFFPAAYGARTPFGTLPAFMEIRRGQLALVRPPYAVDAPWWRDVFSAFARFFTFQRLGGESGPVGGTVAFSVKRVIALPGDTVFMKAGVCYVRPAGSSHFLSEFELSETAYDILKESAPGDWDGSLPGSGFMERLEIPEGLYFVIGDNRGASADSRHWGLVGRDALRGMALFRYWPLTSFGPVR